MPVTWASRPAGAVATRWSRIAEITASAPLPAAVTSRLTAIISSLPSALRSIEASSGRLSTVATLVTASRTTAGASPLVSQAAVAAM